MLTVYGYRPSSNVQVVMWGIGELGLPFSFVERGHAFGGLDTPEFRARNPHGLVPVLEDGDLVVWESCAILRYLAARYGDDAFWPKDPAARSQVDMWAEWGKGTLRMDFTGPIFWARVRTPAARRDEAALTAALARFDRDLATLEAQVGDGEVLAQHPGSVADHPGIAAYYARLCARPAFAEHVMVSYDSLRDPDAG